MGSDRKWKAVIFDMDGLMFDSERMVMDAWQKVGEEIGYSNLGEDLYPNLGTNRDRQYFLEKYGEGFPFDQFRQRYQAVMQERIDREGLPKKRGLRPLLEYLKEKNYRMAVATSSDREYTLSCMEREGLLDYFQKIVCGDMVEKIKPDPEIYLKACQALDVGVEEAIVLEDSRNGIRAALAAGTAVIMIPDLLRDFPEEEPFLAAKLDSLGEVPDWLDAHSC